MSPRFVDCSYCGGEGGWVVIDQGRVNTATIDPPYRDVVCPECEGDGQIEIEDDAIELEDLEVLDER